MGLQYGNSRMHPQDYKKNWWDSQKQDRGRGSNRHHSPGPATIVAKKPPGWGVPLRGPRDQHWGQSSSLPASKDVQDALPAAKRGLHHGDRFRPWGTPNLSPPFI